MLADVQARLAETEKEIQGQEDAIRRLITTALDDGGNIRIAIETAMENEAAERDAAIAASKESLEAVIRATVEREATIRNAAITDVVTTLNKAIERAVGDEETARNKAIAASKANLESAIRVAIEGEQAARKAAIASEKTARTNAISSAAADLREAIRLAIATEKVARIKAIEKAMTEASDAREGIASDVAKLSHHLAQSKAERALLLHLLKQIMDAQGLSFEAVMTPIDPEAFNESFDGESGINPEEMTYTGGRLVHTSLQTVQDAFGNLIPVPMRYSHPFKLPDGVPSDLAAAVFASLSPSSNMSPSAE